MLFNDIFSFAYSRQKKKRKRKTIWSITKDKIKLIKDVHRDD